MSTRAVIGLIMLALVLALGSVQAATRNTPLTDLGTGTYLGFPGGLYPNGSNTPPQAHHDEGVTRASRLQPLDSSGQPSASGKIVLLSLGMSNTSQEFCCHDGSGTSFDSWTFMGQAAVDGAVNHSTLVMVNGALPGETAQEWDLEDDPWQAAESHLRQRGITTTQVQVIWMKHANLKLGTTMAQGVESSEAVNLMKQQANIIREAKRRFPNLQLLFLSSRTYAGYSKDNLNPEPHAYEVGFGVKWLIEAQINQIAKGGAVVDGRAGDLNYATGIAPWIGWGPYLWADDNNPRSDGFVWLAEDFDPEDGRHPSQSGEQKVGALLLNFMKSSPYTCPWFTTGGSCAAASAPLPSAPSSPAAPAEPPPSTQRPFPWIPILAVSGIISVTGLIVYLIRRRRSIPLS